jgi:hypothetical protein
MFAPASCNEDDVGRMANSPALPAADLLIGLGYEDVCGGKSAVPISARLALGRGGRVRLVELLEVFVLVVNPEENGVIRR